MVSMIRGISVAILIVETSLPTSCLYSPLSLILRDPSWPRLILTFLYRSFLRFGYVPVVTTFRYNFRELLINNWDLLVTWSSYTLGVLLSVIFLWAFSYLWMVTGRNYLILRQWHVVAVGLSQSSTCTRFLSLNDGWVSRVIVNLRISFSRSVVDVSGFIRKSLSCQCVGWRLKGLRHHTDFIVVVVND